jgi:hypothetical protein
MSSYLENHNLVSGNCLYVLFSGHPQGWPLLCLERRINAGESTMLLPHL